MTIIRPRICDAARKSWLMNSMARLNSRLTPSSRSRTWAWTDASSADTASSEIRITGPIAKAAAVPKFIGPSTIELPSRGTG